MYSIFEASVKNIKKGKVMKNCVVKKHIHKEALFDKDTFRYGINVVRSEGDHIYGQHLNKAFLSPFNSKHWFAKNGVDTLTCGHKDAVPYQSSPPPSLWTTTAGHTAGLNTQRAWRQQSKP